MKPKTNPRAAGLRAAMAAQRPPMGPPPGMPMRPPMAPPGAGAPPGMKCGGATKKMAKGGGVELRGKTRGKVV